MRPLLRLIARLSLLGWAATAAVSSPHPLDAGVVHFTLDLDHTVRAAVPLDESQPQHRIAAQLDLNQAGLEPPPAAARPQRAFPARLLDDLPAAARAPLGWERSDWGRLGLGALAVGAVSLVDQPVNRWFDDHRNAGADELARDYRPLGQEAGLILLGAAWLGGRAADNHRLEAIGADGLEASLLTALVVTPLKLAFGRVRPRETDDHGSFWAGGRAFPSGETAQAFTMAAVVAAHSRRTWLRVTAWTLAGLVGVERLELDAHWVSDVVAGALIGSAVGHWVVARNRPRPDAGLQVAMVPLIRAGHYGIAMHLSF